MSSLRDLLKSGKKVFKLVCGAGNECAQDVERLVYLYSKAGCQFFDVCAKPEIVKAAKRGLERSGVTKDRFICVSVGIKGDPHILKAKIDAEKCQKCRACEHHCINDAIKAPVVDSQRCLGCGKCFRLCPAGAIEMVSVEKDLDKVLPELVQLGIDCVEFHATIEDDEEIFEKWSQIQRNFDGLLSVCIDRMNLGNKQVLARVKRLLDGRKPFTTIVQADGIPMSGSDDKMKTTLQAVAMGEIIQDAKLPVFVLLSGGTNSKTVELAKMCDINYDGVAIGSYARKIVKEFILRDDFFENEVVFLEALGCAQRLVNCVR